MKIWRKELGETVVIKGEFLETGWTLSTFEPGNYNVENKRPVVVSSQKHP